MKYSEDYYSTNAWKAKRKEYVSSMDHRNDCAKCSKKYEPGSAFNLHHKTYRGEAGKESLDDLVMLCQECHSLLHASKPKKKSLSRWTDEFISAGNIAVIKKASKKAMKQPKGYIHRARTTVYDEQQKVIEAIAKDEARRLENMGYAKTGLNRKKKNRKTVKAFVKTIQES